MNRITGCLITAALLSAGTPVLAGPCEQLAGGRWLYYMEGGPNAYVGAGIVDFRKGLANAPAFGNQGPKAFPKATPSLAYGDSSLQEVSQCQTLSGKVARLTYSSGATVDWTLAVDGKTATLLGAHVTLDGMTGWAVRTPATRGGG